MEDTSLISFPFLSFLHCRHRRSFKDGTVNIIIPFKLFHLLVSPDPGRWHSGPAAPSYCNRNNFLWENQEPESSVNDQRCNMAEAKKPMIQ
jgi:hypothetical protein